MNVDDEARKVSAKMGGTLSPSEVKGVWSRHPEWGPGGKFYEEGDAAENAEALNRIPRWLRWIGDKMAKGFK